MDLEKFIYAFNLLTTLTIADRKELYNLINNKNNKEIDYSNSINFYKLVELFNKQYIIFKKEYEKLEKINFGEYIRFFNFGVSGSDRYLGIYISGLNKEISDKYDSTILYLFEENGTINSYITNDINPFSKEYYREEIRFDNNLLKNYLDFVQKYNLFLESYYDLKNKFIYGDGTTVLFSRINGEIFEELKTFELSFGNVYFNSEDNINVIFNLGENFSIDYDVSKVVLEQEEVKEAKKESIDKLVNNLFVDCMKLTPMYEKGKQLIKEKK